MPNFGVDRGVDAGASGAASTWDASLVDYDPAGAGAVQESVEAALQRIVFREQYSTLANYEAARDALSGTAGLNNLEVTGTLEVDGVNVMTSLKAFGIAMAIALG
jgi:hypothetical protein